MELRQLKYFVKAAETLNFSEAAKALYVTQSTLSQQVRQLEDEIGIQLFERSSHNVILTEAGQEMLPYAIEAIHSAASCVDRINDLKQMLTGTLKIGVTYTFIPILTETVDEFMKRYPAVRIDICCKPMEELMQMLQKREVDFVLAFKPTRRYPDINSYTLFYNRLSAIVRSGHHRLSAIVRSGHPIAERRSISLKDLSAYNLIMPARGLQSRNAFEAIPSRSDYEFSIRAELNEVNILLQLVSKSNLVSVLSEATIHNEPLLKAIPIDAPGSEMEGCVHVLKNTYRKRSAHEFIQMLNSSSAVSEYRTGSL